MDVLVVGTGRIARQYLPIVSALKARPIVVGRSEDGVRAFSEETGTQAVSGGVTAWAKNNKTPRDAIVTVDADQLAKVTAEVIRAGAKRILVEKPGGMNLRELKTLAATAARAKAKIFVAYNRRFYAPVLKAEEIIKKDGGVESFSFQFNERLTQRETLPKLGIPKAAQDRWFIVNSTHILDLAFYLCGEPKKIVSGATAGVLWGKQSTFFSGAGRTRSDVPFTYHSNWELVGPWRVEIGTKKRKLIFDPIEKLSEEIDDQVSDVAVDDELDNKFKPGLYLQVRSFLKDGKNVPTLKDQINAFPRYEQIESGTVTI